MKGFKRAVAKLLVFVMLCASVGNGFVVLAEAAVTYVYGNVGLGSSHSVSRNAYFIDICEVNGKTYAYDSGGNLFLAVKDDLSLWELVAFNRVSGTDYNLAVHSIFYGNGIYLATLKGGELARSTDGVNWSRVQNHVYVRGIRIERTFSSLLFRDGTFILENSRHSSGDMLAEFSTDGLSWRHENIEQIGPSIWFNPYENAVYPWFNSSGYGQERQAFNAETADAVNALFIGKRCPEGTTLYRDQYMFDVSYKRYTDSGNSYIFESVAFNLDGTWFTEKVVHTSRDNGVTWTSVIADLEYKGDSLNPNPYTPEPSEDGLTFDGQYWYYYQGGVKQTGFHEVGAHQYYFDPDFNGAMAMSYREIGGNRYFFNQANGIRLFGLVEYLGAEDETYYYYVNDDGTLFSGDKQIGENWYHFIEDAYFMRKGLQYSAEDDTYYFYHHIMGIRWDGWYPFDQEEGTNWYYFSPEDGKLVIGEWAEDGRYAKPGSGAMAIDETVTIGDKVYTFGPGGNVIDEADVEDEAETALLAFDEDEEEAEAAYADWEAEFEDGYGSEDGFEGTWADDFVEWMDEAA